MKRNTRKLGNAACMVHRDTVPLRHGRTGDPKISSDLGEQAPLLPMSQLPQQNHSLIVHASQLSRTEHILSRTCLGQLTARGAKMRDMEISLVIKKARHKAKLTQRDLATRLKVSNSAVAQWETAVTMPSVVNRVELARLLDIPFKDLVPEGEISAEDAIKDPAIAAIVQQLAKFPEPIRQSVLIQVTALGQALDGAGPPDAEA